MRLTLLTLAITLTSPQSFAQDDPKQCAAIESIMLRVACYDRLFRSSTETTKSETSKWTSMVETSKITDKKEAFISVQASQPYRDKFGRSFTPVLNITCRSDNTDLFLNINGAFLADSQGFGEITYRADKRVAFKRKHSPSTNHQALGLWTKGAAVPVIKQLLGAKTLLVVFTPYSESPQEAEFEISGIDDALKPIRELCKW